MPPKPWKACATPLCPRLTQDRLCEACAGERAAAFEQARAADHAFYHTARWRRFRSQILARDPFCVDCLKEGRVVPSTIADHDIPRRGRRDLELDPANVHGKCKLCHDRKTAAEDGGFGNRVRRPNDDGGA